MRPFAGVTDAALLHAEAIRDRLWDAARIRARDYAYGWRTARDLLQVAGSGATLWLLWRRKRLAVPASIATAAVTVGPAAFEALFDLPEDTPETLQRRVMEQAEWILLPQAAEMLSANIVKEKRHD